MLDSSTGQLARPTRDSVIRVVIFPTLPVEGARSMDRYAGELLVALGECEGVQASTGWPNAELSQGGAPPRGGSVQRLTARFVRYPLVARRARADVFHIADQSYAHLASVLEADRVVATCHDLMVLRTAATGWRLGARPLTVPWYRFSVSYLRRIAHVVCVSETTREDAIRLVGIDRARTSVIPNGVDQRFKPLEARRRREIRARLPSASTLIMHVGAGTGYKNVEGTLDVLACVRSRGEDAILVRAGNLLTTAQRSHAERLRVLSYVTDLGRISDERLVELYNAADVFLFPSLWEGFGWPALEALACGTPVVASSIPALKETLGAAAVTAPADDVSALTDAIVEICTSPELRSSLRRSGLARAAEFSWQRTASQYADVYDAVSQGTST